jgi:hypothetical protein
MLMTNLLPLLLLSLGCAGGAFQPRPADDAQPLSVRAEPWPEADALFRKDPRWRGGDDAYSVDLGGGRLLWLFADSFIAAGGGARRGSEMVRNSVAIQRGYDPSSADIRFYWTTRGGKPASFFAESGKVWHWPGHGIRLGDTLVIFLMKVRPIKTGFGFEVFGWAAVAVDNPDDEPSRWQVRRLETPDNNFGVIVGSASVLRVGDYVYAFGAEEPRNHNVFVVRWPVSDVINGDLMSPRWWAGESAGWVAQSRLRERPPAVFLGAQTEFTVHYESRLKRFVQIQTEGFGDAEMAVRWATEMTGPWSSKQKFYRPEEASRADALIYAGKAHPTLTGAEMVLTYVVNSRDFGRLVNDESIYYPRFLKVRFESKP